MVRQGIIDYENLVKMQNDSDEQCDKCSCIDIMDKKLYDELCTKFENAKEKRKIYCGKLTKD